MRTVQFGAVRPVEIYLKEGEGTHKANRLYEPFVHLLSRNGVNDSFQARFVEASKQGPQNPMFAVLFADGDFRKLPIAEFTKIGSTPVLVTGRDAIQPMLEKAYDDYFNQRNVDVISREWPRPDCVREVLPKDLIQHNKPVKICVEKNQSDSKDETYSFVDFIA